MILVILSTADDRSRKNDRPLNGTFVPEHTLPMQTFLLLVWPSVLQCADTRLRSRFSSCLVSTGVDHRWWWCGRPSCPLGVVVVVELC